MSEPMDVDPDKKTRADEWLTELVSILDPEDVSNAITHGDKALLTNDHGRMLRNLDQFANPGPVGTAGAIRGGGDSGTNPNDNRGGAGTGQGRPNPTKPRRAPMLGLARNLDLDLAVLNFIDKEGLNARAFWAGSAGENTTDFPRHLEECLREDDQGGAFMFCVAYLDGIGRRSALDAARTCFMWLFFFDVTQYLNERNDTNRTGRRMGKNMMENTLQFISQDFYSDIFANPAELTKVKDKVEAWTRRGLKLQQLCEEFGEGALFFLAPKLSEDFVDTKYRESGDNHDKTFTLLRDVDLKGQARATQATGLGESVRKFMMSGWGAGGDGSSG